MEPKPKRGPAPTFTERVSLYENEEGVKLLNKLAAKRGTSQAGLLRQLVREEAARQGVKADE
jgi:hypothetical protein